MLLSLLLALPLAGFAPGRGQPQGCMPVRVALTSWAREKELPSPSSSHWPGPIFLWQGMRRPTVGGGVGGFDMSSPKVSWRWLKGFLPLPNEEGYTARKGDFSPRVEPTSPQPLVARLRDETAIALAPPTPPTPPAEAAAASAFACHGCGPLLHLSSGPSASPLACLVRSLRE